MTTVMISPAPEGGIVAEARNAETDQGEQVQIRLLDGTEADTLLIGFKDKEAFDPPKASCKGNEAITATSLRKGTFEYRVVVTKGGRVFSDLNCPSFHVK